MTSVQNLETLFQKRCQVHADGPTFKNFKTKCPTKLISVFGTLLERLQSLLEFFFLYEFLSICIFYEILCFRVFIWRTNILHVMDPVFVSIVQMIVSPSISVAFSMSVVIMAVMAKQFLDTRKTFFNHFYNFFFTFIRFKTFQYYFD